MIQMRDRQPGKQNKIKNKIMIITQVFYPDHSATAKIMYDIAEELSKNYKVTVLSQNRSYKNDAEKYKEKETINNIDIRRIPVTNVNKNNNISKIALYLAYMLGATAKLSCMNFDLSISVSNPPFMYFLVSVISKVRGKKNITIIHDLYPEMLNGLSILAKNDIMYKILTKINKISFNISDKIIAVGRDMKYLLRKNYHLNKNKISVITNWGTLPPSEETCKTKPREMHKNIFCIVYSGNISEPSSVLELIKAANILSNRTDIKFYIVGDGKLKERARKLNTNKNLKFIKFLTGDRYLKVMKQADLFFVGLKKELFGTAVPSKTYTYIEAEKPIIASIPRKSEIDLFLKEKQCGIVSYNNHKDLAEKISLISRDPCRLKKLTLSAKHAAHGIKKKEIVTAYNDIIKETI